MNKNTKPVVFSGVLLYKVSHHLEKKEKEYDSVDVNSNGSTSQDSNGEETEREMGELDTGIATKLLLGDGDNESLASVCFATASSDPAAAEDLEDAITTYLRRASNMTYYKLPICLLLCECAVVHSTARKLL